MIFKDSVVRFATEIFRDIEQPVWEGRKLVEYGESEMDIRFLEIPEELQNEREEILRAFEEGVTAMVTNFNMKIGKIY